MTKSILIATHNLHKLKEIRAILSQFPLTLLSMDDFPHLTEPEEIGKDYITNAMIKACHASQATGLPCIGDDTGLEVDILNGQPGLHSARWAGVSGKDRALANNQKMLNLLANVPLEKRTARFICVIVLVWKDRLLMSCQGICPGRIILEPHGDLGFGYDPLFEVPEYHKTFAELPENIKNQISHRGRALAEFQHQFIAQHIMEQLEKNVEFKQGLPE